MNFFCIEKLMELILDFNQRCTK